MHIEYADEFKKSIKKIKDKIALERLALLIKKLEKANSLKEISNVKVLDDCPFTYRIRTGDYRLIVEYLNGAIVILLLKYCKRNEKTYKNYN
jgi:mRNA-degrading endonuclease RelE of RelBE toxin-antitoxin system